MAKFNGFEGKFYQNRNREVVFTAKAKGVEVL